MSPLSQIEPGSWPAISAILDEALALPEVERDGFLGGLVGERAKYAPVVRSLLPSGGADTGKFLATLPSLHGVHDTRSFAEAVPGALIGPYRLIREVGVGGMGSVWLAERADGSLKRKVALKLPRLAWVRGLAERMARERDILAALEHPNIARLYDAGVDQHGRPYLSMEYVDGQPIDVWCRERAVDTRGRVELLLQVCQAVAYAHSRLVIHRDLKPTNILVTSDGQVRLLDFGIAKLAEGEATGTALTELTGRALTLDYASPEQVRGDVLTTSSDIYSLGVVAYEVLAGARPYKLRRGSAAELEEAVETADIPLASEATASPRLRRLLRGDLDAILNKALKKTLADRYATVAELAADFHRHRDGLAVHARPDSFAYRLSRWIRRNKLESAVVAALAVMLLGGAYAQLAVGVALAAGALAALWQARRSRKLAEQALDESARADAMQRFVLDLFRTNSLRQPDPLRAQATTARELLELGSQRLLEGDAGMSVTVRTKLVDALFDLVDPLHLYDLSARLARQRIELREQTDGEEAPTTIAAWLDLLNVTATLPEGQQGNLAQLERLRSILRRRGEADGLLAARTEQLMGLMLTSRDLNAALAHFDRAVAIFGTLQPGSPQWAEARYQQVQALGRAERYAEAAQAGEDAVAVYRAHGNNSHLIQALRELAEVKGYLTQYEEAEALFREALALGESCVGPRHASTIAAMHRFATLLRDAGRWQEAERIASEATERCVTAFGPDETFYLAQLKHESGLVAMLRGRFRAAESDFRDALARLLASRPRTFGHAMVAMALARALLAQGRADEALVLADEVSTLLNNLGFGAGTTHFEMAMLLRAEIALTLARPEDVRQALGAIRPDEPGRYSRLRLKRERVSLLEADLALLEGRVADAAGVVGRAVASLETSSLARSNPHVAALAYETQARVFLALGEPAAAEEAVRKAILLREASEASDSGWVAAARTLQARCRD